MPIALLAGSTAAFADPLTVTQFGELALRCAPTVAPSTLASIASTESRFQPLTINDNTTATSGVPATREIAVQIASSLLEAGHSLDLGIMQINSANFRKLGLTPETAFDPCVSTAAAARILTSDYAGGDTHAEQQSAVRDALSKYNTGDAERGFANGYVHKVELAAQQIVPALDVTASEVRPSPGMPVASPIAGAAGPVPARAPNTPPPSDVWASTDVDATSNPGEQLPAGRAPERGPTVLANDSAWPGKSVNVNFNVER